MQINYITKSSDKKHLLNIISQFNNLSDILIKKNLPENTLLTINDSIDTINNHLGSEKELYKLIKTTQTNILKKIEKENNLRPKNYYRNMWIALGMSAIGIPMGMLVSSLTKNMGLFAIGLPIGLGIGSLIGVAKDKKVYEEGNQLDIEIKY